MVLSWYARPSWLSLPRHIQHNGEQAAPRGDGHSTDHHVQGSGSVLGPPITHDMCCIWWKKEKKLKLFCSYNTWGEIWMVCCRPEALWVPLFIWANSFTGDVHWSHNNRLQTLCTDLWAYSGKISWCICDHSFKKWCCEWEWGTFYILRCNWEIVMMLHD